MLTVYLIVKFLQACHNSLQDGVGLLQWEMLKNSPLSYHLCILPSVRNGMKEGLMASDTGKEETIPRIKHWQK